MEFTQIITLKDLDLSFNSFEGQIGDLKEDPALSTLLLSNNQFSGPLPDFSKQQLLRNVSFSSNAFTGGLSSLNTIGTTFGYPIYVDVSRNMLSGQLQACGYAADYAATLIASHNSLSCYASCWNIDDVMHARLVVDENVKPCQGQFPQAELQALEALYTYMGLGTMDKFSSWDFSKDEMGDYVAHPCDESWYGINCNYDTGVPRVSGFSFTGTCPIQKNRVSVSYGLPTL